MNHLTTQTRMKEESDLMAEKILELTLEIVYVLTGEAVPFASADHVTIKVSPLQPLIPNHKNRQKILEVTRRITELLTEEEQECLEGSRELCVDTMKTNQPPLPSLDGSNTRNSSERFRPFFSCVSVQDKGVQQRGAEDMIFKVKVETEELYISDHNQCLEVETPLEIRTDGQYTNNTEEHPVSSLHGLDSDYMDGKPLTSSLNSVFHGTNPSKIGTSYPSQSKKEDTLEKLYTCSQCWKCFATKSQLTVHYRVHTAERPFSCSNCGKCFPCKSKLITHERVHLLEKPFPCGECRKCFSDKTALVAHERLHTGEKPFSCLICGKCFPRKSALTRHENIHTGERPYSCPECGKTFARKEGLAIHKAVHAGEKLFSCAECGKCFSYQSALIRHEKLHTGLRPYSCSECGKSFFRKSALSIHERVHTGEKPYSCPECGKCFSSQSHFIMHKRVHTQESPLIV